MANKNTWLIVILFSMILAFIVISDIKKPLQKIAELPRCDNGVIITEDLKASIINFSNNRIISGTGSSYFYNHFIFVKLNFDTENCVFVVRYEFVYDELHKQMDITVKALSSNDFTIVDTNSFLRPVFVLVTPEEAIDIVKSQNITYDFYNLEIDIPTQTMYYKFYKESVTGEISLVAEIDAQSKQITYVEKPKPFTPLI